MKMILKLKNAIVTSYFRRWLGVPLTVWLFVLAVYYWWLISRIISLEDQNKLIKNKLTFTQSYKFGVNSYISQPPFIPDSTGTLCETIHIALVCMGTCSHHVTPMLKSILHHRQNQLHLHIAVDDGSQQTLSTLLDTWDLPDVKYSCYTMQYRLGEVNWIPNTHYSGVYAMVKLLFPDMLPKTLDQVIVLDTDLTFLCDIAELWSIFMNMTDEQAIGLVENESTWYYDTAMRWPALGKGYNTGVMLLDLHKIRYNMEWKTLWRKAVDENLERLKKTHLADQDIINAIIKSNPSLVYNISCIYNVQMSTMTLAKNCYGEDQHKVKIVHWNSPRKYNIMIKDADYFRNIHQSYVNLDGNLLREKLHKCTQPEGTTYKMNNSDICKSFRAAQLVKLRTHLHYIPYTNTDIDNFDVTLVLQFSMDRLQFLQRLVKHWEGPISAAVYLSDCEVEQFSRFANDAEVSRDNIAYHLVFKLETVHYPVNYLRNVALENARTPYVFLMDVDFVPMSGLYQHLRDAIRLINPYPQKKCLVVAAFESQLYRAQPPRSKPALLSRLHRDVAPFRAREWPSGHRPTNYTRWATATKPYEVEWQPDYEPYLVVHKSVSKYDTRFSGFGWNKVSHSVLLSAQRYRPVVLPDAFVVHTPHAPSPDITAFRADAKYRVCLALLKHEFMEDLKKKYNVTLDNFSKRDAEFLVHSKSNIVN